MNEIDLERQVLTALETMLKMYQQLDGLADQMLVPDISAEALDDKTLQLKMQRESIEQLESTTRSIKDQYRASREHASPAVNDVTNQLAGVMQRFLMKISDLEKRAKGNCETLRPQIHSGVRAVQMKNAYGKYV